MMIDIAFPDSMKKNSRIVIYGAAFTGIYLAKKIIKESYGEIVCFVDRQIQDISMDIPVYLPEWLESHKDLYDYILIGTTYHNTINSIKNRLNEIGIDKAIVGDRFRIVVGNAILNEPDISLVEEIQNFGNTDMLLFQPVIYYLSIFLREQKYEKIIQGLCKLYYETENEKTKFACMHLLSCSGNVSSEMYRNFHKYCLQIVKKHPIWVLRMVMDLESSRIVTDTDYLYDTVFQERRQIASEVAQCLIDKTPMPIKKKKHIAICCNELGDETNNTTQYVSKLANELADMNHVVSIFIEPRACEESDFFIYHETKKAVIYREAHQKTFSDRVSIFYPIEKEGYKSSLNQFVHNIFEFAPEFIIYYGGETSCSTHFLVHYFPVVFIPSVTTGTSGSFHILAVQDKKRIETENKKFHFVKEMLHVMEFNSYLPQVSAEHLYNRKNYLLPENAFVVVTVGNGLEYEIDDEQAMQMVSMLQRNSDMIWLLVGTGELQVVQKYVSDNALKHRVKYISYEKDLLALYRICDVYFNPIRMGGGISVALAMMAELPVVVTAESNDGAVYAGYNNVVQGGLQDAIKKIEHLADDSEYYIECKENIINRVSLFKNTSMAKQFIEMGKSAEKIFI